MTLPTAKAEPTAPSDTSQAPSTAVARVNERPTVAYARYKPVGPPSGPTVLAPQLARLVSILSASARASMKTSHFITEYFLESLQYGSQTSLEASRRCMLTAVSSARRFYMITAATAEFDIEALRNWGEKDGPKKKKALFEMLDRYTNMGIHLINNSIDLAAVFTFAGINVGQQAVDAAHVAAQESLDMIDNMFGGNDMSKSVTTIYGKVHKEMMGDQRFKDMNMGRIATGTALTKALTTFICLQNSTWEQTAVKHRMKLLEDVVVLNEDHHGPGERSDAEDEASLEFFRALKDTNRNTPTALGGATDTVGFSSPINDYPTDDRGLRAKSEPLSFNMSDEVNYASPSERRRGRKRSRERRDEYYEVSELVTESTVVTHELGSISRSGHRRVHSEPFRYRSRSQPPAFRDVPTSQADPLVISTRAVEDDWMEVEVDSAPSVTAAAAQALSRPSMLGDKGGTTSRVMLEQPIEGTNRTRLALRTITDKVLSRKKVIRRMPSASTASSLGSLQEDGPSTPAGQIDSLSRGSDASSYKTAPDFAVSSISAFSDAIQPAESKRRSRSPFSSSLTSRGRSVYRSMADRGGRKRKHSPSSSDGISTTSSGASPDWFDVEDETEETRAHSSAPPSSPVAPVDTPDRQTRYEVSGPVEDPQAQVGAGIPRSSSFSPASYKSVITSKQSSKTDTPDQLFPHDHLVNNIHRYMKFASAAYGQGFLRWFGMGTTNFNFPSTGRYHANSWAFAQHTDLPIDAILLSSYSDSTPVFGNHDVPPLVHYLAVDHQRSALILTCRGTLGLSDLIIDATCDYCAVPLDGADSDGEYFAHSGMYASALSLSTKRSLVHEALASALKKNPTYGVIITGHSLGGGVAALLSVVWAMPAQTFMMENEAQMRPVSHPPITTPFVTSFTSGLPAGRPIHCYAYGVPAVASPDLSKYAKGLITSVVHRNDWIPTLSYGLIKDLKNIALTLMKEQKVMSDVLGHMFGNPKTKFFGISKDKVGQLEAGITPEEATRDRMLSYMNTMRADMHNDKLIPPGDVYIVEYQDVFVTVNDRKEIIQTAEKGMQHKKAYRAQLHKCDSVAERFREPVFGKSMIMDHLPSRYELATKLLVEGQAKMRPASPR